MTNIIIILVLISTLAGVGLYLYWQVKKSGRNEIKLENEKKVSEGLHDENEDLSNRPRLTDDVLDRLHKWADQLPEDEDESKS